MQNQRHIADSFLDSSQRLKGQAFPVGGIYAVDVANTSSQNVNAQISNHLAFLGICAFAFADDAVFFAADCTDLSLNRDALGVCQFNQFFGLSDILVDRIMRTVKHDGREASFDALLSAFIGAVVQMQSDRDGDAQFVDHAFNHANDGGVAAHILASALGNTEDYGRLQLLSGKQDRFGPFKVVDVELANCIMAVASLVHHFCCRN